MPNLYQARLVVSCQKSRFPPRLGCSPLQHATLPNLEPVPKVGRKEDFVATFVATFVVPIPSRDFDKGGDKGGGKDSASGFFGRALLAVFIFLFFSALFRTFPQFSARRPILPGVFDLRCFLVLAIRVDEFPCLLVEAEGLGLFTEGLGHFVEAHFEF